MMFPTTGRLFVRAVVRQTPRTWVPSSSSRRLMSTVEPVQQPNVISRTANNVRTFALGIIVGGAFSLYSLQHEVHLTNKHLEGRVNQLHSTLLSLNSRLDDLQSIKTHVTRLEKEIGESEKRSRDLINERTGKIQKTMMKDRYAE
eukprot:TRINITY_DN3656_c0_g2_i2.p1 TRINITY_DN3656_c0_g2~~TRINITY_DN3656_c0_g2_i2.p1  ORF type:complete len:145 (-),score=21.04 TRINITY_DN3656_c0_g2_i2:191-625(-)